MGRAVLCTICQLVSTNNYLGFCFVYLSSQFLQFLCKILHNLSAYIVPICQLVSSKSLNFVFRTTSLVNAPFREMFCKHFEAHINRGERQKLKEMVISKSNLDIQEIFNPRTVFWCDVSRRKVAALWLRFQRLISPHTHFSNKSFVMRFVKQTNCSRTILLFIPSLGVHLWDALSEWSPLPAKKLTTETHL